MKHFSLMFVVLSEKMCKVTILLATYWHGNRGYKLTKRTVCLRPKRWWDFKNEAKKSACVQVSRLPIVRAFSIVSLLIQSELELNLKVYAVKIIMVKRWSRSRRCCLCIRFFSMILIRLFHSSENSSQK